jgi:hypothetical protein
MYCISDQQIDFILADLRAHGICTESLQNDLLDHVCILIERGLEEDGDFEQFYSSAIRSFYKQELFEIEEETSFLLTYKRHWVFSRAQFFGLLLVVLIGPFVGYNILCMWMVHSGQTHKWNPDGQGWDGTLVFALYPFLVFLILLLTPDRFDPLIPRNSKILVGIRPFIKILRTDGGSPGEASFQ